MCTFSIYSPLVCNQHGNICLIISGPIFISYDSAYYGNEKDMVRVKILTAFTRCIISVNVCLTKCRQIWNTFINVPTYVIAFIQHILFICSYLSNFKQIANKLVRVYILAVLITMDDDYHHTLSYRTTALEADLPIDTSTLISI